MKYELRNKCYDFCTNIMVDGDKEKLLYESEIVELLNNYEKELAKK